MGRSNTQHGPRKTRTKTQTTPDSVFTRERRNSDHGLSEFLGRENSDHGLSFPCCWGRGRRGGSQNEAWHMCLLSSPAPLSSLTLFRSEPPIWGRQNGVTPICSDLFRFPFFFRFVPICGPCFRECPDLFRFAPISSDLLEFVPICFDSDNQNKSGKPPSADPFCKPRLTY